MKASERRAPASLSSSWKGSVPPSPSPSHLCQSVAVSTEKGGRWRAHGNVFVPHLQHDRQRVLAILHGVEIRIQDAGVDLQGARKEGGRVRGKDGGGRRRPLSGWVWRSWWCKKERRTRRRTKGRTQQNPLPYWRRGEAGRRKESTDASEVSQNQLSISFASTGDLNRFAR
jgi:hypothetical protein